MSLATSCVACVRLETGGSCIFVPLQSANNRRCTALRYLAVRPSVRTSDVCPLTPISRQTIPPYLMEGFERNLAQIFIARTDITKGFQGQRSKVKVIVHLFPLVQHRFGAILVNRHTDRQLLIVMLVAQPTELKMLNGPTHCLVI